MFSFGLDFPQKETSVSRCKIIWSEKIDGRLKLTLLSQLIVVIIKIAKKIILFVFISLVSWMGFFVNRFYFFHATMGIYLSGSKRCVSK